MKKARYFVFILSLLAFVWSEVSVNYSGNIASLISENRTELEAQPSTAFLSTATKSVAHKKIDPETTSHIDHSTHSRKKQSNEATFDRTSKLFIVNKQLLL
ncbi:MAG: hypothetical protein AB8B73_06310 [Ekhidna sp.]